MKIKVTSIYVDNQDKALRFYTEALGFAKKTDFSQGPYRWLTVASPEEPDGTELQLALNNNPAAKAYQQAMFQQGQPAAMFFTDDVKGDYERIKARGAEFTMPPKDVTGSTPAATSFSSPNWHAIHAKEKKVGDREQYTPGPASGAQIRKDGEKWTLILVRELRHSPEKVWQALTDPAHLREWAPFDADASLGMVGNTVKLTTVGAPAPRVTETTVTRADAPEVLEYKWGGFDMRWELEALGGGTRLTLWTNIGHRFIAMGAAGWHICFDVLDHLLGGTPIGRMVGPDAMKFGGWQRLNAEYAKQFGIESPNWPPEAAQKS